MAYTGWCELLCPPCAAGRARGAVERERMCVSVTAGGGTVGGSFCSTEARLAPRPWLDTRLAAGLANPLSAFVRRGVCGPSKGSRRANPVGSLPLLVGGWLAWEDKTCFLTFPFVVLLLPLSKPKRPSPHRRIISPRPYFAQGCTRGFTLTPRLTPFPLASFSVGQAVHVERHRISAQVEAPPQPCAACQNSTFLFLRNLVPSPTHPPLCRRVNYALL